MSNNFFHPKSYYFICDVCGFKFHKEQMKRRWDNVITCPTCWEARHPQDFLKVREDRQAVNPSRPRPADVFIYSCSTRTAIVGIAQAGCAIVGRVDNP